MSDLTEHEPRPEEFPFNLDDVLNAMVSVRSNIPEDAFTAQILGTERAGNGVVVNAHGLVLTIGYLITEAEEVWLTDYKGRATKGFVVGYDQESGFGLVQPLGKLDLPYLEFGNSSSVQEGDHVLVAGFGGVHGSLNAEVIAVREFAGYWEYYLETAIFTAPAHPNWGGTALVGLDGKLVGIGSLMVQQDTTGEQPVDGNMIVPINILKPIFEEISTYGRTNRPPRPWMGLFTTEVEDRVVVVGLALNGPADQAEIMVGDIVVAVNGKPISSLAEMFQWAWSVGPAGTDIPITLHREGEEIEVNIQSIDRDSLLKTPQLH